MADGEDPGVQAEDGGVGTLPAGVHYVDLLLGGWRPREAAHQLAISLGVELGIGESVVAAEPDIGFGIEAIDAGACGDPLIKRAWEDASSLEAALPADAIVVVFAPQFGLPLRADNEWLFYFLHRLGRSVVAVGPEPDMHAVDKSPFEPRSHIALPQWRPLPDDVAPDARRLLRLFPGLLPWRLVETASLERAAHSLIPDGAGHFLIPIACRDADPRDCAFDFDALGELEAEDEGFQALAQTYCTSHFAEIDVLAGLGLRHFRAGYRDLGRDLVARARSLASDPGEAARTEVLLLEMSLFEQRYSEIIAEPRLSRRAGAAEKARLQGLKHCARLAVGDLSAAPEFVPESLRRLGDRIDAADVLRLNGAVRARRAAGDLEGALNLGRSVAAALARRQEAVDPRLVYANAIGLAGLYLARGEYGAVGSEVDRAFAASQGARCASEVLAMNVLRGKAAADQTAETARTYWLKAALAWLSLEPREGLGRDATELILGTDKVAGSQLDSEVSAVLADALADSWPEIEETSSGRLPDVCPASALPTGSRHMYAGPGAAILWTNDARTMPPSTPPRARLRGLVCAAIARICPPFSIVGGGMMAADANLGMNIPGTRDEALSVALRLGVEDFCFGEERLRLGAEERRRLAGQCEVRLSPIVSGIAETADGLIIGFRRYLPKLVLSEADARLIEPLRNGARIRLMTLPIVADGETMAAEARLRDLEARHVVRVEVRAS